MQYANITNRLATLGAGKWAVHFKGRQMADAGIEVIELTIGEPDLPPATELFDVANQAMRAGRTRYSNGRGEPNVLAALAEKYSTRSERKVSTENILCFPGTQTALFTVILGLAQAGDAVMVPDPFYATYEGVIRSPNADMVPVPMERVGQDFKLTRAALEKAWTPSCKVLLLNSPHNPTGSILSAQDIAEIGDFAIKHDLWIVSDEVYEDLIFDGTFASPFDDPRLAERTVAVSSISKSHAAPGFRSGWAVGPQEFCQKLLPISETMLFGNQPFIADMTAHALQNDSTTAANMRSAYHRRARMIYQSMADSPTITAIMPHAGMFIVLDIHQTGLNGDEFAERLLQDQHVSVMPGSSFGDVCKNYIRLSLSVPDEQILLACQRIKKFSQLKPA